MINLCVTRIPGCCDDLDNTEGCVVGDAIVSELIQTNQVAESAGRAYLDDEGPDFEVLDATCSLTSVIEPGKLYTARDKEHGTYTAEVQTVSMSISRSGRDSFSAQTSLQLKRLATDE